jgi:NADPH-dependent ferric siderophore reductase
LALAVLDLSSRLWSAMMSNLIEPPESGLRGGWSLLLVASHALGDDARHVSLVGEDLEGFVRRPGQRVALALPAGGGVLRRVCAVADFDAEELRLDLTLPIAQDADASRWVQRAQIGDPVTAVLVVG